MGVTQLNSLSKEDQTKKTEKRNMRLSLKLLILFVIFVACLNLVMLNVVAEVQGEVVEAVVVVDPRGEVRLEEVPAVPPVVPEVQALEVHLTKKVRNKKPFQR